MDQVIQLTGARVALDESQTERIDVRVRRGRILPFDDKTPAEREYDLSGHLLLPGLINAHDHLEFGLYPRLGNGPWANARDWASDIHTPEKSPVKEHRSVPRATRLVWGAIRNLICGVTTVAHHNPFESLFSRRSFPVRVVRRFGWAHSLDFSPDIVERRHSTPPGWPFVVHAAEGSDSRAQQELTKLDELGVLDECAVLIHVTGATGEQLARARARRASIVWCPTSNLFTIGRTLSPHVVRWFPTASLGTDSGLTAEGDLIDEMRVIRSQTDLTAAEIYRLVTSNPARALRLNAGEGGIRERGRADLIAVRDRGQTPCEALADLPPELVLKGGEPVMMAERFRQRMRSPATRMHSLGVESRGRFLMSPAVPDLCSITSMVLGDDIRLAGKLVSA
jgi:cytosine/adenosine deaminase-related metal-dependent hydrolase